MRLEGGGGARARRAAVWRVPGRSNLAPENSRQSEWCLVDLARAGGFPLLAPGTGRAVCACGRALSPVPFRMSLYSTPCVSHSCSLVTGPATDDARFLTAITSPKIVEVGVEYPAGNVSVEEGDGFAVISFKTGPNVVSLDFTASCYVQDWSLPTNDCKAIAYERNGPAGESWTGQTGKIYTELTGAVTGLGT